MFTVRTCPENISESGRLLAGLESQQHSPNARVDLSMDLVDGIKTQTTNHNGTILRQTSREDKSTDTIEHSSQRHQHPTRRLARGKSNSHIDIPSRARVYFNPSGRGIQLWHCIISVVVVYHLWVIIYRYAFAEVTWSTLLIWFMLDYTADLLYLIDMAISVRTGFLEDGVMQFDRKRMRIHYLNCTQFYIDLLSLLPLDFLYLSIGFNSMLRVLRLCKVYKFWHCFDRFERHATRPNLVRCVKLVFYYLTILHWNACSYKLITDYMMEGSDTQDSVDGTIDLTGFDNNQSINHVTQLTNQTGQTYVGAVYWGMLSLIPISNSPIKEDTVTYVVRIGQSVFGVLLFATILGHVSSIIAHTSAGQKAFQARLDKVKTYLALRRVPDALQARVIQWFDYLWYTNKITDEANVLNSLPDKLRAEIAIQMHLDTLKRVEIFQNAEEGFLSELVLRLRMVLFAPGDYVCRKGEIGKQMFIVNRGTLHVIGDDESKTILATLRAGSYFGELSILNLGPCGNRRSASVRSLGYSDLFCLSKSDLCEVLKDYPGARRKLELLAYKKIHDYKMMDTLQAHGRNNANPSDVPLTVLETSLDDINVRVPTTNTVVQLFEAASRPLDGSDGYASDPSRISLPINSSQPTPTPAGLLSTSNPVNIQYSMEKQRQNTTGNPSTCHLWQPRNCCPQHRQHDVDSRHQNYIHTSLSRPVEDSYLYINRTASFSANSICPNVATHPTSASCLPCSRNFSVPSNLVGASTLGTSIEWPELEDYTVNGEVIFHLDDPELDDRSRGQPTTVTRNVATSSTVPMICFEGASSSSPSPSTTSSSPTSALFHRRPTVMSSTKTSKTPVKPQRPLGRLGVPNLRSSNCASASNYMLAPLHVNSTLAPTDCQPNRVRKTSIHQRGMMDHGIIPLRRECARLHHLVELLEQENSRLLQRTTHAHSEMEQRSPGYHTCNPSSTSLQVPSVALNRNSRHHLSTGAHFYWPMDSLSGTNLNMGGCNSSSGGSGDGIS